MKCLRTGFGKKEILSVEHQRRLFLSCKPKASRLFWRRASRLASILSISRRRVRPDQSDQDHHNTASKKGNSMANQRSPQVQAQIGPIPAKFMINIKTPTTTSHM